MSEASVIMKFKDEFSAKTKTVASANQGLSKSMEELQAQAKQQGERLTSLLHTQASLRSEADKLNAQIKQLRKSLSDPTKTGVENELQKAHEQYTQLQSDLRGISRAAKDAEKDLYNTNEQMRHINLPSSSGMGGIAALGSSEKGLFNAIKERGIVSMGLNTVSGALSYLLNSGVGEPTANYVGGIISGAAQGFMTGGWAGAAVGAATGLINAGIQEAEKDDEAYRETVKEQYETQLQDRADMLTRGRSIASEREMTALSYTTLLGGDEKAATVADSLLADIKDFSNRTPYTYSELTGVGRTLLSYDFQPEKMVDAMKAMGAAAAATGGGAASLETIATVLGRLKAGMISAEQLNMLTNIGLNPYRALANQYNADHPGSNVDDAGMRDMISKKSISGEWAATALIEEYNFRYGEALEKFSQATSGLESTLGGLNQELEGAMGAGYNKEREKGLQEQIAFVQSDQGDLLQQAYGYMGEFQASLDNMQDSLKRDAITAIMQGDEAALSSFSEENNAQLKRLMKEYKEAVDKEDGAEMGRILAAAESIAYFEYTQSDGYKTMMESNKSLAEEIQESAAGSYYTAGRELGQQLSKGVIDGIRKQNDDVTQAVISLLPETINPLLDIPPTYSSQKKGAPRAFGMNTVPYNGYLAELHQGERVLTAAEARAQDEGTTGGSITVNIGDVTVREPADADLLAEVIVERILEARKTFVR